MLFNANRALRMTPLAQAGRRREGKRGKAGRKPGHFPLANV
jgi:hypothetical protein